MLPLSLEVEPMEDLGTQVSERTNITTDSINDRIQAITSDFFVIGDNFNNKLVL